MTTALAVILLCVLTKTDSRNYNFPYNRIRGAFPVAHIGATL